MAGGESAGTFGMADTSQLERTVEELKANLKYVTVGLDLAHTYMVEELKGNLKYVTVGLDLAHTYIVAELEATYSLLIHI